MFEIEPQEITSIILSLPGNKSAGLDGIYPRILKENTDILVPILCKLFNHSLKCAKYPSVLKIAKVVPVYKDGDRSNPSSYRPISVLSVINNIYEKILSSNICKFLEKYNLLCQQQHGFRKHHSTASAVLSLTQLINTALHENKLAAVVFVDLKKAFDTVDHAIMLNKLNHYGFRGEAYSLLSSYIENRQQAVVINNIISSLKYLQTGVPQGSVLGPMLFSLYLNDLPKVLSCCDILMYADDTAIIVTADNHEDLEAKTNAELKKLHAGFLPTS